MLLNFLNCVLDIVPSPEDPGWMEMQFLPSGKPASPVEETET